MHLPIRNEDDVMSYQDSGHRDQGGLANRGQYLKNDINAKNVNISAWQMNAYASIRYA